MEVARVFKVSLQQREPLSYASNPHPDTGIQSPNPREIPMNAVAVLLTLFSCANRVVAQNPLRHPLEAIETRYASAQPVIRYTLRG